MFKRVRRFLSLALVAVLALSAIAYAASPKSVYIQGDDGKTYHYELTQTNQQSTGFMASLQEAIRTATNDGRQIILQDDEGKVVTLNAAKYAQADDYQEWLDDPALAPPTTPPTTYEEMIPDPVNPDNPPKPLPAGKEIIRIDGAVAPIKTTYTVGDTLDLAGLVIRLTYNDDSTTDVPLANFAVAELSVAPENNSVLNTAGTFDIVVTHTKGISGSGGTFVVDPVTPDKEVKGIAVTTQPKLDYEIGQTLELDGIVVTLTYNDETTEHVTFDKFAAFELVTNPLAGIELADEHNGISVDITYKSDLTCSTDPLVVAPLSPELTELSVIDNKKVMVVVGKDAGTGISSTDFSVKVNGVDIPAGTTAGTFSVAAKDDDTTNTRFIITFITALTHEQEIIVTGKNKLAGTVNTKYYANFLMANAQAVKACDDDSGYNAEAAKGAIVTIKLSSDLSVVATTEVDAEGKFKVSLPAGTYNVYVTKEGYKSLEKYGITLASGEKEVWSPDEALLKSLSTELQIENSSVAMLVDGEYVIKVLEGKNGNELDAALGLKIGKGAADVTENNIVVRENDSSTSTAVGTKILTEANKVFVTAQAGEPVQIYSILLIPASELDIAKIALEKGTNVGTVKLINTINGQKYSINGASPKTIAGTIEDNISVKVDDVIKVWTGDDPDAAGKFKEFVIEAKNIQGGIAPEILAEQSASQGGIINIKPVAAMTGYKLQISRDGKTFYDLIYNANESFARLPDVVPAGSGYKLYKLHTVSGAISDGSIITFMVDNTKPTFTVVSFERSADATAKIVIKSDKAGQYCYLVGGTQPVFDDETEIKGDVLENTDCTINLAGLTAGAKTVWVAVKDLAGNFSAIQSVSIPAFSRSVKAETYTVAANVDENNTILFDTTNNIIKVNTSGTKYDVISGAVNYDAVSALIKSLSAGDTFTIDSNLLISAIEVKANSASRSLKIVNEQIAPEITITPSGFDATNKLDISFANAFTKKLTTAGSNNTTGAIIFDPTNFAGDLNVSATTVVAISANKVLNIESGKTLSIAAARQVVNNGTINVKNGGKVDCTVSGAVHMPAAENNKGTGKMVYYPGSIGIDVTANGTFIGAGGIVTLEGDSSFITLSGDYEKTASGKDSIGAMFELTGSAKINFAKEMTVGSNQTVVLNSGSKLTVEQNATLTFGADSALLGAGTIEVATGGKLNVIDLTMIPSDVEVKATIQFNTGALFVNDSTALLNGTTPFATNTGMLQLKQVPNPDTPTEYLAEWVVPAGSSLTLLKDFGTTTDRLTVDGTMIFGNTGLSYSGTVFAGASAKFYSAQNTATINVLRVDNINSSLEFDGGKYITVNKFGGNGSVATLTGTPPKVLSYYSTDAATATADNMAVIPSFMAALRAKSVAVSATGPTGLNVGQWNNQRFTQNGGIEVSAEYEAKSITLKQSDYNLLIIEDGSASNRAIGIHNLFGVYGTPNKTPTTAVVLVSYDLATPKYIMIGRGSSDGFDAADKFFINMNGRDHKKVSTLIMLYGADGAYCDTVELNIDWSAVTYPAS